MSAVIQTTFNENDPQYRCCCKICHVKLGALIIGYIHLAFYALGLALMLLLEMTLSSPPFGSTANHLPFASVIVMSIVAIAIVGLMLYGAHKENHCCIVPFLVVTAFGAAWIVLNTIVVAIAFIISVIRSLKEKEQYSTELQDAGTWWSDKGLMALVLLGLVLALGVCSGVQIWIFNVVLGGYLYCRDKRNALKESMASIETERGGGRNRVDEETPSYLVKHLATFAVGKQYGLEWPDDGIRKLKQMEKNSAIWAQPMVLRLRPTIVSVEDANGELVEQFPMELVADPSAHLSMDPRDIYNNILLFVVREDRRSRSPATPTEMHILQCNRVSATEVVDDFRACMGGHFNRVKTGRRDTSFVVNGQNVPA